MFASRCLLQRLCLLAVLVLPGHGLMAADVAPARATAAAMRGNATAPVSVVYHLSDGLDQAARAMGNIHNHLIAEPDVHIVVVGLANGVDFMVKGAHDARGNAFEPTIAELAKQGVEFRACNNTLQARNIDRATLVPQAKVVPAGVAEITRLQFRDGYAYFRP